MPDQMTSEQFPGSPAKSSASKGLNDHRQRDAAARRHPAILRVTATGVAGILSVLLITAVAPPIVADQSDRAVVNAPVTLLTAPIGGDIDMLVAAPGSQVRAGDTLAQISNPRLDRGTLISLEENSTDARQQLQATRAKIASDQAYVAALDKEIAALRHPGAGCPDCPSARRCNRPFSR
jgi:multidrug resistance efflux pump